jgi:hypothetical protein
MTTPINLTHELERLREQSPDAFALLNTREGKDAIQFIAHLVVHEPERAQQLKDVLDDILANRA